MSRWAQRLGLGCVLLAAVAHGAIASETPPAGLVQAAGAVAERKNVASSTAVSRAQGLGQLLIRDAQSGSMRRLDVARYHVHVVLQPPVALVQIDQAFFNPFSRQEEGTFVFNLPRGASVSRFAMYVTPDQLVEGELIERERAVNVYESIVSRRRDPALLEQIGDNLFRMRVFPIPARDVKRILLDYTIPLESERDEYQFQLPLWSDLNPIGDFRLTGTIKGPTCLDSVTSLSHPEWKVDLPDKNQKGQVTFTLEARNYRPESDFLLKFVQPDGGQPQFRSYQAGAVPQASVGRRLDRNDPWANRAATYFLAAIPPMLAEVGDTGPADVLILADTSAGMRHNRLLPEILRAIIGHLRPCDRFQLACVDVGLRPLTDKWLVPEPTSNQAVLARFDKEYCLGGTDLVASFREAVQRFDSKGSKRRRVCLYLGDGEDTLTMMATKEMEKTLVDVFQKAGVPLYSAVVRRTPKGTPLLEALASQTGGQLFQLTNLNGQQQLLRWVSNLAQPARIVSVAAAGVDSEDLFCAKTWTAGQPLYVYGRAPAETERVELRLTVDHHGQLKTERWEFNCRDDDGDVFVGRLWAQKKLDQWRPRVAEAEVPDEVQEAIVALSREWSLLSPHTAFLVLESEADYDRWGIVRQQRRRYWRPAEAMPKAPLPADWVVLNKPKPAERRGRRKRVEAKQYAESIASAREALAANDGRRAHAFLERVKNHPLANSSEYADLRRQVDLSTRRERLVEQLGLHRSLLDPAYGGSKRIRIEPSLNLFSLGQSRGSQAFVRQHPHYEALLQTISLEPRGEFTVQRLCDELRGLTGANVMLDLRSLEDVGLDRDTPLQLQGWGKMSLRNYTRFLLRSLDLVFVEEPHGLLITIPEEAETLQTIEIYPVADLYSTAGPRDLGLLSDPYLDHDEAAERRLQGKLQRSGSFDFREKPLRDALREIAQVLEDAMVVDQRAIDDVGVSLEDPVTMSFHDVPLKEALKRVLEQLDLTYYPNGDALVISTPEEAEARLITKLHSLRGIICDRHPEFFNLESSRLRRSFENRGWFGGALGGMPGMDARSTMGGMGVGSFGGQAAGIDWRPGQAGVSSVDTQEAGDLAPTASSEAPVAPASEGMPTAQETSDFEDLIDLRESVPQPHRSQGQSEPDFDSLIELITSMIQPTTWDEVGGPGSIAGFAPTLDLVVAATMDVHDEIEEQLRQLRELPVVDHNRMGARLAQPPTGTDVAFDPDGLCGLIAVAVAPTSWNEVGGPASIAVDEPRMALVVSQTAEVHDELAQLLCRLRRSRYEILYGLRPWESAGSTAPMLDCLGIAGSTADLRLAKLPEPNADELAALAVRRQPAGGQWTWRYYPADNSTQPQRITLRTSGQRAELELAEAVVRLEDDRVAVAYPGLGLVEHGNWAEVVRQTADAWLPWLPHRSNEQLARLFVVQAVKTASDQEPHRVRFIPNGQPETAGTYLEVTFARDDGQMRGWESYLNGKRTGRLRLNDGAGAPGVWRTAILEDAAGKTLARWELVEASEKTSAIPELTHGWDGYVQLDRRTAEPAVDPAFRRALEAIQKANWPLAMDEIRRANQNHPGHPLLQFLSAWCVHHDGHFGTRADVIRLLKQVAASRATLLTRFVGMHFQWLTPEERYDLLRQMPRDARRPLDWDQLAQAAMAVNQWEEALASTEIVLAAESVEPMFERRRRHVELLLRLGRNETATDVARQWAAGKDVTSHQCARMGELLARHGCETCASELFDRALAQEISRDERYVLLRRRADLLEGLPRWRLLLEAAALQPAGSPSRAACVGTVRGELGFAQFEIAGQLADKTAAADLHAALRLRQAELAPDDATTAELLWKVRSSDQFSPEHFHWACRLWNDQRQADRVVRLAEGRLRAGLELPEPVLVELARAYRQLGRPRDARRAETVDLLPGKP